jgi:SpoVK/Ycf46/Vps4 family AAA+-type ATPase
VLSTFLNEMDGITTMNGKILPDKTFIENDSVFVLAACNDLNRIDAALLRPGRMAHNIHIGLPTSSDVTALLQYSLRKLPADDEVTPESISELLRNRLHNVTAADISGLFREAVSIAILDEIKCGYTSSAKLRLQHFKIAMQSNLDYGVCSVDNSLSNCDFV